MAYIRATDENGVVSTLELTDSQVAELKDWAKNSNMTVSEVALIEATNNVTSKFKGNFELVED